ncbi:MAG: hypothetical protein RL407_1111 [Bacteroidota bacterium]|jgi:ubiquinone/menaquinone biosynthesis C-methylase UbiE
MDSYLHGFSAEEQNRLKEQADILAPLVFKRVDFSTSTKLLEVGSGVGAQTLQLLTRFPQLHITCVDQSSKQLEEAKKALVGFESRLRFLKQDGCTLAIEERFDSAFVCWTLEHVSEPRKLLARLREHLIPGSKVYLTEVFNASFYVSPGYDGLEKYMANMSAYQKKIGGHPDVGIELGNLLKETGFASVETVFDGFYFDKRNTEGKKKYLPYWKELLKSAFPHLLSSGFGDPQLLMDMENDFEKLAEDENAIFFYQFVQAKATPY